MAKLPQKEFIALLEKHQGFQSSVAKDLGISCQAVSQRIHRHPKIEAAYENILIRQVDFAESKLHKNISDGKETSIIYFLNCKGRDRGYRHRTELTGAGGKDLIPERKSIDLTGLSDAALDEVIAVARKNESNSNP